MIAHCLVPLEVGNVWEEHEVGGEAVHEGEPGVSVTYLVLPTGTHVYNFALFENEPGKIARLLIASDGWVRRVSSLRLKQPFSNPPCFITPDGKILRSSDYQEVF